MICEMWLIVNLWKYFGICQGLHQAYKMASMVMWMNKIFLRRYPSPYYVECEDFASIGKHRRNP